jgi:hypothetical protein
MPNKTFMRAATALAMFNAIDTIREVAEEHDKLDNMEYIDNMFILSMVSHSIASDKDKKEVMDFLMDIANRRNKEEQECLINNARNLL